MSSSARKFLAIDELVDRAVYRLQSRNLIVGIWRADKRDFLGVREKFDSRFLFGEYEWSVDPHVGTARARRRVDIHVPVGMEIDERNEALLNWLLPITDEAIAEVLRDREEERRRREEWEDSHPITLLADSHRLEAKMRRWVLLRSPTMSKLIRLYPPNKVKYHRDQMRHYEKLAIQEWSKKD